MRRVFDDATKQQFDTAIQDSGSEINWFLGIFDDWLKSYPDMNDPHYQNDINAYYRDLFQINDTSKRKIQEIFDKVAGIDQAYGRTFEAQQMQIALYKNKVTAFRDSLNPVDGVPIFESSSFSSLLLAVNDQITAANIQTLYENYCVDFKWEQLLGKAAGDITEEEYAALALIYLDMDESGKAAFISSTLHNTTGVLDAMFAEGHYDFVTDNEKLGQVVKHLDILTATKSMCEQEIAKLSDEYFLENYGEYYKGFTGAQIREKICDEIRSEINDDLQDIALLKRGMQISYASLSDSVKPIIEVTRNENGDYFFSYPSDFPNISATGNGIHRYTDIVMVPAESELAADTVISVAQGFISVKFPYDVDKITNETVNSAAVAAARDKLLEATIVRTVPQGVIDAASRKLGAELAKKVGSNILGVVTFGVSTFLDVAEEQAKQQQDHVEGEAINSILSSGGVATLFHMRVTVVRCEKTEQSTAEIHVGSETQKVINSLNYVLYKMDPKLHSVPSEDITKAKKLLQDLYPNGVSSPQDILNDPEKMSIFCNSISKKLKEEIFVDFEDHCD